MSITKCLGNINVSEDEATRVKDLAATHRYEGMSAKKANVQAAQDVLKELMNERAELGQKIAEQGGALPSRTSTVNLSSRIDPENVQAAPSVDMERMAKLLGPQLYGNMKDIGVVTIKEMFQNSFDALKGSLESGKLSASTALSARLMGKTAEVSIDLNESERTITFTDNGTGMTPSTINKAFLTLAGTQKETDRASGGLGIAKMLFLFGNDSLSLKTVRDGVESILETTGEQLMTSFSDPSKAPTIETSNTSAPSGTTITVKIPEFYTDDNDGSQKPVNFPTGHTAKYLLEESPLLEPVYVKLNGKDLSIGAKFPADDFTVLTVAKFPWGKMRVMVKDHEYPDSNNVSILSNGLYQFGDRIKIDESDWLGKSAPYKFYLNIEPDVAADSPAYPISLNRKGFSAAAADDFAVLKKYIATLYANKQDKDAVDTFGTLSQVSLLGTQFTEISLKIPEAKDGTVLSINKGDKVEVVDGRLILNGEVQPELTREVLKEMKRDPTQFRVDQSLLDPEKIIIHDNALYDGKPFFEEAAKAVGEKELNAYLLGIGKTFKRIRDAVARHGGKGYETILDIPVGVSMDQKYYGVNTQIPFKSMMLNPAMVKGNDPDTAVGVMIGTMVHESAHHTQKNHSETGFIPEMQRLFMNLAESGDLDVARNMLELVFGENRAVLEHFIGIEKYESGRITPKGVSASGEDQTLDDSKGANGVLENGNESPDGSGISGSPAISSNEGSDLPGIRIGVESSPSDSEQSEGDGAAYEADSPVAEGSTVSFSSFRGLGSNEASIEVTKDDAIEILGFDPGIEIVTAESGTMKIDTPMAFNLDTRQIQINPDYPATPRWEAAQFMVEEMLHSVDVLGSRATISASSAMFGRNGAIFLEAEANFKGNNPELRRFLAYPLHDYFELSQTEKQAELFARLGVLYLGDPQLMQETMPNAYKLYDSIFTLADNNSIRPAVRQDTGSRRQVPSELSESTDVSEVRADATGAAGQSGASAGLGRFRDAVIKATKGDRLGSRIQLSGQFLNVRSGVGFGENWVPSKATLGQIEGPVLSVKHILTKEGRAQRIQAGRRRLQDAYIVWRDIQDAMVEMGGKLFDFSDAYGKFTQIEGKVGEQFKQIEDRYTKPLQKGMLKKKVSIQQLGDFLMMKAVPGRNAKIAKRNKAMPDGGSGIMTDDAVSYLDSIPKERTKDLEELSQYIYDMLSEKQDILVKSGRMSDSLRDQLNEEEPFYVPMKGSEILDDANQMVHDASSGSRGFDQTRDLFKTALGRKTVAADIVATAMSDTASAIINAENNIVGKAVLKFTQDNPNKNLWKINPIKIRLIYNKKTGQVEQRVLTNYKALAQDPNVFVTWVNGKPYAIEFRDGRGGPSALARALKNMEVDSVPWYIRHLGGLNRYLSYMNTALSPEFLFTNPARDIQTALGKAFGDYDAAISGKILKNLPRAIKGARHGLGDRTGFAEWVEAEKKEAAAYEALSDAEKKGKPKPSHLARYIREYLESGGKTDYFRNKTVEEMKLDLENGLKEAQGGGYNAVKRGLRQLGLYVEHANGILENSTRISMYITLREEMTTDKNGKVIHKYSPHQAAVAAKNLTVNFNRKGEDGVLVNSLFLFYNASMQGTHLTLQLLKKPKVQAMMVALGGAAAALVQYNILMGGDDDDGEPNYFRIGDYEKERNLIIMWADGSGNYTKWPLPWGLNVPINAAQAIVHVINGKGIRGQSPMEQAAWVAGNAWNSFSPVGESGMNIIAPTVLDPFVDIITNKNFAESKIMPDKNPYEKVETPNAYRAFSTVDPWWRIAAESLNKVTRGNEQKSGYIDVSPEAIEHLVNTYTGAAGGFVGRVATWISDPEMPTSQKPFVRKVFGDVSEYVVSDRYADNKASVFYLSEREEFLGEKSRNSAQAKAEFDEFKKDNIEGLRLENYLKSVEGNLRELYTDRRELRANPVRNKSKLDRIESLIEREKREFNKQYNEVFMP